MTPRQHTDTMIVVDLYLRLSDGRNENGSFADRESKLRNLANQRGWIVGRVVTENDLTNGSKSASAFKRRKIKLPNGETAWRVVRPGFRSVLADLAAGRAQAVLAEDLDRVVRDPRDLEDLLDVVQDRGAYADSLSGSLRVTAGGTDAERMMARIAVTVANKSSSDTARRVAAGRERQAVNGQFGGGRRPYGFTLVSHPAGGHQNTETVVNEHEASVIRQMAADVLAGVSLRSIAKGLRDRDEPTVTGARWSPEMVKEILTRPRTAGIAVYKGEEIGPAAWAPILERDTWEAIKSKLSDSSVEWLDRSGTRRAAPRTTNAGRAPTWLLSGVAKCVCGSVMELQAGKARAASYRCAHDENSRGDVHARRNAAHVDDFVSRVVVERLSRPDAVDLLPSTPPGGVAAGVDLTALREQVKALRSRKLSLAAEYGRGDLDSTEYAAAKRGNAAKLAAVEATLAAHTPPNSPLEGVVGVEDVQAAWDALSLGRRRSIVATLVDVTILPTSKKGRGFDPTAIRIEWKTTS